jgi:predicted nuclease of predicted toxin-antitoxin system
MRFLVDACAGPALAARLNARGWDAASVHDETPPPDDAAVLLRARREQRILITTDKGLGERVVRHGTAHAGIVLLRLADESTAGKIATLQRLLGQYGDRLAGSFVVVTEQRIRFVRP